MPKHTAAKQCRSGSTVRANRRWNPASSSSRKERWDAWISGYGCQLWLSPWRSNAMDLNLSSRKEGDDPVSHALSLSLAARENRDRTAAQAGSAGCVLAVCSNAEVRNATTNFLWKC